MNKLLETLKVHSSVIGNIWGAVLAEIPLMSKYNKESHFLLFVTDIYNKYA